MPDFTIPTRPWLALLLGAFNTALAFIVGAKTTDSGLDPVTVFYMACALAVMGWVLLHIVPSNGSPVVPAAEAALSRTPTMPIAFVNGGTAPATPERVTPPTVTQPAGLVTPDTSPLAGPPVA